MGVPITPGEGSRGRVALPPNSTSAPSGRAHGEGGTLLPYIAPTGDLSEYPTLAAPTMMEVRLPVVEMRPGGADDQILTDILTRLANAEATLMALNVGRV